MKENPAFKKDKKISQHYYSRQRNFNSNIKITKADHH
jgi:hypothetical protein